MLIWTCVSVGTPRACPLAFAVFRIALGKPKVSFHVSQSNADALKSPRVRGLGRKIIPHFWLWVAAPLLLTAATFRMEPVREAEASLGGEQWERCLLSAAPESAMKVLRFLFQWCWEWLAPSPSRAHGFPGATCHENKKVNKCSI